MRARSRPRRSIDSPDWYAPLNAEQRRQGGRDRAAVGGAQHRVRVEYQLQWAPGIEPLEADFENAGAEVCRRTRSTGRSGRSTSSDVRDALDALPNGGATVDATAPRPGPRRQGPQRAGQFTVRVKVTDAAGNVGEDRKVLFALRDPTLHEGCRARLGPAARPRCGCRSERRQRAGGDRCRPRTASCTCWRPTARRWPASTAASRSARCPTPTCTPEAPVFDDLDPPLERAANAHDRGHRRRSRTRDRDHAAGEHVYVWDADGSEVDGCPVRLDPSKSLPARAARSDNHVKRGFTRLARRSAT